MDDRLLISVCDFEIFLFTTTVATRLWGSSSRVSYMWNTSQV
jgi:hypothetical protein